MLIAGEWREASSGLSFDVHEPATGRVLAQVVNGEAEDIDAAVTSARECYEKTWSNTTARNRGSLLLEASQHVLSHIEELAELETKEMGKPLEQSLSYDLAVTVEILRYFGGLADKVHGDFVSLGYLESHTIPEPFGVVGAIIPFNWPPVSVAGKAGPALAAGNCVVMKPAEQAPLTVLRLAELLQDVLPPGVINVVPGKGPSAGAALAGHAGIGKVSFTGSTTTGKAVLHSAADNITPALLELGGKNPLIIFPDADIDAAVRGAIEGMFFNQGEACTAASRILVHEAIRDEFMARYCSAVSALRVGDGMEPDTDIGPMVTAEQAARVRSYVEKGLEQGAVVAAQAPLPDSPSLENGFYVAPLVLDRVEPWMVVATEEIFGPISTVITFRGYEEAIALANGTEFGLVAAVYSRNLETTQRASHDIRAGVVMVNNYNRNLLGTPFGGYGHSGYGREHAMQTIYEYTRTKNVRIPSGNGEPPTWRAVDRVLSRASRVGRTGPTDLAHPPR
ncbi:MAG: aldehyde dehydrogenase family protein [Acidimicrobiia bacterium]